MITPATELALGALLLTAAGWDIARRRIPNLLVFLGLLVGLALAGLQQGLAGLGLGLAGVGVAFALTFPQWALRWLGGGDAKLLMAVGAFVGPALVVSVLLYALVGQAVLGVGFMLARRVMHALGRPAPGRAALPMAVPIAAGAALALRLPLL